MKFNLKMDDRPIEHKPSTNLLGDHIDEMLTLSLDDQIKYISSKVSNGWRMLYLKLKLKLKVYFQITLQRLCQLKNVIFTIFLIKNSILQYY